MFTCTKAVIRSHENLSKPFSWVSHLFIRDYKIKDKNEGIKEILWHSE